MLSASGDFNGDGFDDLAIGIDGETVSGHDFAGGVQILYGSASKLKTSGNQLWTLDSPGINGVAHANDFFGAALAVGDFNGDGFDDLAIGTPSYTVNGHVGAGAVNIIYGSSSGLRAKNDQQFTRETPGVNGAAQSMGAFASALAAGDFNGDGRDDLAIGSPNQKVSGTASAGAVNILYGGSSGLKTTGDQYWTQDSPGINGASKPSDFFGGAVAAGDFNGDGRDDLAIGDKGEAVAGKNGAGAVNVIYGSSSGLKSSGDQLWHQDVADVLGTSQAFADFGISLAVGHFNTDKFADLAVGAPRTNVGAADRAGAVNVLYGSSGKLTTAGNQLFTAPLLGLSVSGEEAFGATLAAGSSRGNGRDELAVGIPNFNTGGVIHSGNIVVIRSTSSLLSNGLTTVNPYFLNQDTAGVADVAELGDNLGRALVFGDFNGDGFSDLAISVPGEDFDVNAVNVVDAGVVHVLYGTSMGISGSGSQIFSQNTIGVLGTPETSDGFGGALG